MVVVDQGGPTVKTPARNHNIKGKHSNQHLKQNTMKEKFLSNRTKPELIAIGEALGMSFPRETKRSLNKLIAELSAHPYQKLVHAFNPDQQ
jgi:hypothetical protein